MQTALDKNLTWQLQPPLKQRTCRCGHLNMKITRTSTKPAPEQVHHLMCKLVQTESSKKCRESKHKSPTRWPEAGFEVIQPQVLSSPCRRKTPLFSEQRLRTGALLVGDRSSCEHEASEKAQVVILIVMLVKSVFQRKKWAQNM